MPPLTPHGLGGASRSCTLCMDARVLAPDVCKVPSKDASDMAALWHGEGEGSYCERENSQRRLEESRTERERSRLNMGSRPDTARAVCTGERNSEVSLALRRIRSRLSLFGAIWISCWGLGNWSLL